MKILTQLTGSLNEGEFREPRGILTTVHVEPAKGIHVKVMLGSAGLVLRRADAAVAVPIESLIALAADHCPELLGANAAKPQ